MAAAMTLSTIATLFLLLSCLLRVYSAPVSNEVSTEQEIPVERECVYQLKHYPHGSSITTDEPCLNCTCNRGVLVCFLRVCHRVIAPPASGCRVVKPKGKCCTELVCGELEKTETPAKSTTESGQVTEKNGGILSKNAENTTFLHLHTTLKSVVADDDYNQWTSSVATTLLTDLHPGCQHNGSLYADGSAMPSDTFCEYCYCIKGLQRCIRPQCHLHIDDCQPIYKQDFSCCPTAYKCTKNESEITTPSTTTTSLPLLNKGCDLNGTHYEEGDAVINEDICQHCFCVNGAVQCSKPICAVPLNGCKPIVQPGKCCPTGYNCSNDEDDNLESTTLDISSDETNVETRRLVDNEENYISNSTIDPSTAWINESDVLNTTELPVDDDFTSTNGEIESDDSNQPTGRSDNTWTTEAVLTERSNDISTEIDAEATNETEISEINDIVSTTDINVENESTLYDVTSNTTATDDYQSVESTSDANDIEASSPLPESQDFDLKAKSSSNDTESTTTSLHDDAEISTTPASISEDEDEQNLTNSFEHSINVSDIAHAISTGHDLSNATAQLVQNVDDQLLEEEDGLLIDKSTLDGNNNFSNWTHLDNETDLLQMSNVNPHTLDANSSAEVLERVTNSPASSSANLKGSLHSIVSSLLAKPEITTEGSHNYSNLFDDLIGESPGEFHFNPISYFNFTDEFVTDVSTTLSSHLQSSSSTTSEPFNVELVTQIVENETFPSIPEHQVLNVNTTEIIYEHPGAGGFTSNDTQAEIESLIPEKDDHNLTAANQILDATSTEIGQRNNSTSDEFHQLQNATLYSQSDLLNHSQLTENEQEENVTKTATILILDDSNQKIDNQTQPTLALDVDPLVTPSLYNDLFSHQIHSENDTSTEAGIKEHENNLNSPNEGNFTNIEHDDVKTNFNEENETTPWFSPESDLEDTIEMILNLSKTFAATNKRPTQWHPSENSSATDLLSATLPADVEAKLVEIVRMAQAGLTTTTTKEPLEATTEPQQNNSFNVDKSTTSATDEGDEYYNEYYDDEARETPSLLEDFVNSSTEQSTTVLVKTHPTESSFVKDSPSPINTSSHVEQELETVVTTQTTTTTTLDSLHSRDGELAVQNLSAETTTFHPTTISNEHHVASDIESVIHPDETNQQFPVQTESPDYYVRTDAIDQLNDKFIPNEDHNSDSYIHPINGEQVFASNNQEHSFAASNSERISPNLGESVRTSGQFDQISEGSSVHQEEEPFGAEAQAAYEEPFEESGAFHQPEEEVAANAGHYEGLTAAGNDEEKSYFSADENFETNRRKDSQPAQDSRVYAVSPETIQRFDSFGDQTAPEDAKEVTSLNLNDGIVTEKLPEIHPDLIKDLIEGIKLGSQFESKETTKFADFTTLSPSNESTAAVLESHPANKLIDHIDDGNNFDKVVAQTLPEQSSPPTTTAELHTEAVTSDANRHFVGLVTKGSIQFDQVLPLSRRGRPTVDEKTGQALPTPRKSNSSVHTLTTATSGSFAEMGDEAPAVIPFLPEDAITDEHILKEQIFGGAERLPSYQRPIIERIDHQPTPTPITTTEHKTSFEINLNASTAINVHDANADTFEHNLDTHGAAIPETLDYEEEAAAFENPAVSEAVPIQAINPISEPNKTEAPIVEAATTTTTTEVPTEREPHTQSILKASALPKFDDYQHRNQSHGLVLQQTSEYCVENGEVFQDGERIPTHDFCAQCRCVKGEIQCQHLSCPQKPPGCTEKLVSSSCCPAFVCNETENTGVPIKSGITIHSGFMPIEGPVNSNGEQRPIKTTTTTEAVPEDHFYSHDEIDSESDLSGHQQEITATTTTSTTTGAPTTKTEEESGIFGSLLEAVFGHGISHADQDEKSPSDNTKEKPVKVAEPQSATFDETTTTSEKSTTVTRSITTPYLETSTEHLSSSTVVTTTAPTTTTTTSAPTKEGDSMGWPMLKVSGCNIYGRVYQLGAVIKVLSGPCKECKCTYTGVDCYKIKCY